MRASRGTSTVVEIRTVFYRGWSTKFAGVVSACVRACRYAVRWRRRCSASRRGSPSSSRGAPSGHSGRKAPIFPPRVARLNLLTTLGSLHCVFPVLTICSTVFSTVCFPRSVRSQCFRAPVGTLVAGGAWPARGRRTTGSASSSPPPRGLEYPDVSRPIAQVDVF